VAATLQVAFLDSADFNGAYDCTLHDNMLHSDMLFTHGKLRSKNSHKDTSQKSEEIELDNLGFDNSRKIPSSSRQHLPWQGRSPTKYLAIKQKQGSCVSMGNKFAERGLEEAVADDGEIESNLDETINDKEEQEPYAYEHKPEDSEYEEVLDDDDEEDYGDGF
jgi:hypothetical protein